MRLATMLLILTSLPVAAQAPAEANPELRFNVLFNPRFFPQDSPLATLGSVIRAAELGQFDYIAAYLMDTKLADAMIAQAADGMFTQVERELRRRRDLERADPFQQAPLDRLPLDPYEFDRRVRQEATRRGFERLTAEVRERFTEDPSLVREWRRYLRQGELQEEGETARLSLQAVPSRAMYFVKQKDRWYMEDRTRDLPAPSATTKE